MVIQVPFDVTIREDTAGLTRTTQGLRQMGREADRANTTAQRGYDRQNESLNRLRSGILGVVGAYVSLHGAIRAIGTIADFEEQLAFGGAVTGSQNLQVLGRQLRDIAQVSKFTALEVSRAFSFLGQTGFTEAQSLQALPGVLQIAEIGLLDVADAADITSNVLKGFGLTVDDLGRVNDTFASAVTSTNTNVRQLGDAMSYAAPTARVLGVSIESAAAAIGVLSDAGVQGERAGTAMRRILIQLNAAGYDLSNGIQPALAQLRDEGTNLARSTDLVGARFAGFLQLLIDGERDVERLTNQFEAAEGTAEALAEEMAQNLRRAIDLAKSAFQELLFTIGDFLPLEEIFRSIADSLNLISRNAPGIFGAGGFLASPFLLTSGANFLGPLLGSFLGSGGLGRLGSLNPFRGLGRELADALTTPFNRIIFPAHYRYGELHDLGFFGALRAQQRILETNADQDARYNDPRTALLRGLNARQRGSDFGESREASRQRLENSFRDRNLIVTSGLRGVAAGGVALGASGLRGIVSLAAGLWKPLVAILAAATAGLVAFNAELRRSVDENIQNIGTNYGAFGRSVAQVFGAGIQQLGISTVDFFNYIFGSTFDDFPELLDTVLTGFINAIIDFIDLAAKYTAVAAAYIGTFVSPQNRIDFNDQLINQSKLYEPFIAQDNAIRANLQSLIDRRTNIIDNLLPNAVNPFSISSYEAERDTLTQQIESGFANHPLIQRALDAQIRRGGRPDRPGSLQAESIFDIYNRERAALYARANRVKGDLFSAGLDGRVPVLGSYDVGSSYSPNERNTLALQEALIVERDFGTPFRDLNEQNRRDIRLEDYVPTPGPPRRRNFNNIPGRRPERAPTEEAERYRDIIQEINNELDDSYRTVTETGAQYEIQQRIREAILDIERQGLNLEEFRNALLEKRIQLQEQQFRDAREREIGEGFQLTGRVLSNELASYLNPDAVTDRRFRFSWSEFGYEAGQAFVDTFIERVEEGFENLFEYLTKLAEEYLSGIDNPDTDSFSLGGAVRAFFGIDPNDYTGNEKLPNTDAVTDDILLENLTGRNQPAPSSAPGITINQAPITINGGDPAQVTRVLRQERRTTIQQVEAIQSRNERLGRTG